MAQQVPPPGAGGGAGAGGAGGVGGAGGAPVPGAITRSEMDFKKSSPKFRYGETTWDVFIVAFENAAEGHVLSDVQYKHILFNSLNDEAKAIACPDYAPSNYRNSTKEEYSTILQELYEPAEESEQMRLEFDSRVQLPGEHPEMYFRDKQRMFLKGYTAGMRDYEMFYDKAINGLINQRMKDSLREFRPEPIEDVQAFRRKLIFLANVQRKKFRAGDITEAEAQGAEAHASTISYRYHRTAINPTAGNMYAMDIKQEPIYAVEGKNSGFRPRGACFACGSREHLIAQCPRKGTGLPNAVAAVEEVQEDVQYMEYEYDPYEYEYYDDGVNFVPRRKYPPKPYRGIYRYVPGQRPVAYMMRPRGRGSFRGQVTPQMGSTVARARGRQFSNRRIAYLYEDENGETFVEEIPEGESDAHANAKSNNDTEALVDGVHSLTMEEQYEAAFGTMGAASVPNAFLGKN